MQFQRKEMNETYKNEYEYGQRVNDTKWHYFVVVVWFHVNTDDQ